MDWEQQKEAAEGRGGKKKLFQTWSKFQYSVPFIKTEGKWRSSDKNMSFGLNMKYNSLTPFPFPQM